MWSSLAAYLVRTNYNLFKKILNVLFYNYFYVYYVTCRCCSNYYLIYIRYSDLHAIVIYCWLISIFAYWKSIRTFWQLFTIHKKHPSALCLWWLYECLMYFHLPYKMSFVYQQILVTSIPEDFFRDRSWYGRFIELMVLLCYW